MNSTFVCLTRPARHNLNIVMNRSKKKSSFRLLTIALVDHLMSILRRHFVFRLQLFCVSLNKINNNGLISWLKVGCCDHACNLHLKTRNSREWQEKQIFGDAAQGFVWKSPRNDFFVWNVVEVLIWVWNDLKINWAVRTRPISHVEREMHKSLQTCFKRSRLFWIPCNVADKEQAWQFMVFVAVQLRIGLIDPRYERSSRNGRVVTLSDRKSYRTAT